MKSWPILIKRAGPLLLGIFALGLGFAISTIWDTSASEPTVDDRGIDGIVREIDTRERSAFQDQLLSDGQLTGAEYDSAFAALKGCLEGIGATMNANPQKNRWGVYDAGYTLPYTEAGVTTETRAAAEDCQTQYFSVVGARWAAMHMTPQSAYEEAFAKVPDCFRRAGFEPPADVSQGWTRRYLDGANTTAGEALLACVRTVNQELGNDPSIIVWP